MFLILVLAASARAGEPALTATLEPARIRLGQHADLSVTAAARGAGGIALPDVDGLRLERVGESSSFGLGEGADTATTTWHIRVTARRAGSFTIPPIEAVVNGRAVRSEPLELTVVAAPEAPSIPRAGGAHLRTLRPVWESGWFQNGGIALVAALAIAVLILRRLERRGPGPLSLRALRADTDRAIAQSDSWLFFAILRGAVQERLAPRWGMAPRAITLAELRSRGASEPLQEFFEVADAVAYSGRAVGQEQMRRWQKLVLEELSR